MSNLITKEKTTRKRSNFNKRKDVPNLPHWVLYNIGRCDKINKKESVMAKRIVFEAIKAKPYVAAHEIEFEKIQSLTCIV